MMNKNTASKRGRKLKSLRILAHKVLYTVRPCPKGAGHSTVSSKGKWDDSHCFYSVAKIPSLIFKSCFT